jgi:hypothetical protein
MISTKSHPDPSRRGILPALLIFLIGIGLLSGCSPDVASPDLEQASQVQADRQEVTPNLTTQPAAEDKLALEKAMKKMNPEDINATLASMQPEERTEVVLRFVSFALLFYYSVYNRYPTVEEGLDILLNPPPAPNGKIYDPFAREVLLLDGWQRKLQYTILTFANGLPGFKLRSLGPDGVPSEDDVAPDVEELAVEVTATIAAGGLGDIPAPPTAQP